MKRWLKILIGIVIVLAVLVGASHLYLGHAVKAAVNRFGPGLLGVPVELDHAAISLLQGKVNLAGLRIGNPDGFDTPNLMEMSDLSVQLDPASIFSDTITIRHIHIDAPVITYEQNLTGNNLGALQDNLAKGGEPQAETPETPKAAEPAPRADAPGKKVVIEDFQLRGAKVNVSLPGMRDKAIPLPLPPIVMTDIGKGSGGASLPQVISRTFKAVLESVMKAVASSADLLGDGAKLLGKGAQKGAAAAGEAAAAAGGVAVDAGKAAGEAAKKGAAAVGDTVGDAGQAVGEGAKKLLGGVKGLIRQEDQTDK